jgi:predicted Fe-S protein YdhL (DUF1289 family)
MQERNERSSTTDLEHAIATARVQRPVGSPCIDVCRLDEPNGRCQGCKRSLDEIRAWRTMTDDQKLRVLDRLAARIG